MKATARGSDGRARCRWCTVTPEYEAYHDREWGFPVDDDRRLFEKLSLEAFQSGLSWRTILAKRENFRAAFEGFDFHAVARFRARDVARLLQDEGIVRHRGKIEATIANARCAVQLQAEAGSLARHVWQFEPRSKRAAAGPAPEAVALARDLKKRGWRFVGPTTVYAFMQAAGLANDHAKGCVIAAEVAKRRRRFAPPATTPR
jgi:DNA-3-methyladenine glycosylase I